MKQFVWVAFASAMLASPGLHAQDAATDRASPLNEIKGRIFDANLAKQTFADGAKFCKDLDGNSNFYMQQRNRVINLDDYHRSLQNLARGQVFNAETKRPWTDQDVAGHWEQAQKEASKDKANCDAIASLPFLEKKLQELQNQQQTSEKHN